MLGTASLLLNILLLAMTPAAQSASIGPGLAVQILTDGPKLRRDEPWPVNSPIFDPCSGDVRLHAARNEFVAFQVLLRSEGDDLKRVTCEVSDLRPDGAEGKPITRDNIDLYRAWYVQVVRPSYTGDIPGLGPGEYPDPLVPLSAPKSKTPTDCKFIYSLMEWFQTIREI